MLFLEFGASGIFRCAHVLCFFVHRLSLSFAKNYVSPARTRKVHESHPKENKRRKATDNAWYPCDGNRNTSLLLSGFSKLLTIDFLKDRLQLELSFIHPPFDAWNAGCVVVGWKEREKEKGRATVPRKGKPFRPDHTWFQKHLVHLVDIDEFVHRCHRSGHVVFCFSPLCFASCTFAAAKHSSVKFMSTWQVFHMMQLFSNNWDQTYPNLMFCFYTVQCLHPLSLKIMKS